MSAFLGPIHLWLYKKIKFQDELTSVILKDEARSVDQIYPTLEKGELSEIIDETNIHGWLQERISLVENRLAFTVTNILEKNPEKLETIINIAYNFGKENSLEGEVSIKEVYEFLENLLLNGMPCDRVNSIDEENDNEILWHQNIDIHEQYWASNNGNVENYYLIRESLIKGILEDSDVEFSNTGNENFKLKKVI